MSKILGGHCGCCRRVFVYGWFRQACRKHGRGAGPRCAPGCRRRRPRPRLAGSRTRVIACSPGAIGLRYASCACPAPNPAWQPATCNCEGRVESGRSRYFDRWPGRGMRPATAVFWRKFEVWESLKSRYVVECQTAQGYCRRRSGYIVRSATKS